jgi:competence protein ComEA
VPDASLPPLPPVGQPRWRTALDDLQRRLPVPPSALVTAVLVVAVLGGAVLLLRPAPASQQPTLPTATPAPAEPVEPGGGSVEDRAASEEVIVDVAGAVARPGLVRLRGGSRVADALAAAGGPAADAALSGVNQARVLADGEQVRVPRVGEPPPPPPSAPSGSAPATPAAPVDLNRATVADLDILPGVGPATAAAIVAWRDENGGFRRVEDLLEVPGIGPARLERLRPHVRV